MGAPVVAGAADVTANVTVDGVLPEVFWATRLYVVVVWGSTVRDPFSDTLVPFNVTVEAFEVVHDRVLDCPATIDV